MYSSKRIRRGEIGLDCGCLQYPNRKRETIYKDLTGEVFGYLTVIEKTSDKNNGHNVWKCSCNHGDSSKKPTICYVPTHRLKNGDTKSCGCLNSKGELLISSILKKLDIVFEQQKTFQDCRFADTDALARFDFYLPTYNILIEYDGIQHFQYDSDKSWNNKINFNKRKEKDDFKNNWCKEHQITLIRIPYYDIEKINEEYIKSILQYTRE